MLLTYPHDLPVVLKIFINAKLETSKEKRIIFWSSSREMQADSGQKFILSLTYPVQLQYFEQFQIIFFD